MLLYGTYWLQAQSLTAAFFAGLYLARCVCAPEGRPGRLYGRENHSTESAPVLFFCGNRSKKWCQGNG